MKKKEKTIFSLLCVAALVLTMFVGCAAAPAADNTTTEEQTERPLPNITNKNVRFVGHSIWWYNGRVLAAGVGGGEKAKGYQTLLKERYNFGSMSNYCYSGYSLGGVRNTDSKSIMLSEADSWIATEGDLWTLDTITNDFRRNIAIGTMDDYTNATGITTYYGALRAFADRVLQLSGKDAVVVCANAVRRNNDGYTSTSANMHGHTMQDYGKALKEVAEKNHWYFVDQFNCEITDENVGMYTIDGLHLNNEGYLLAIKPWFELLDTMVGG